MVGGPEVAILAPGIVAESPLPRSWHKRGLHTGIQAWDDPELLTRAFRLKATPPAAPLHYLGMTGQEPGGFCLFAWPVYLHPRREELVLMTGEEFEPDEAEAESLIALLAGHFPDWRIERTADAMWFIIMDQEPELDTTPLQHVLGENIDPHLPRGADGMKWHGILNEVQMVLFEAEVNQRREAEGRPPVNSLWVWGGGRLPEIQAPRWRRVVSNDPVALGLARCAGLEARAIKQAPAVEAGPAADIAAPDTLWVYSRPGGAAAPEPVLSAGQWASLKVALRSGDIESLSLIDPAQGELRIDRRDTRSWLGRLGRR